MKLELSIHALQLRNVAGFGGVSDPFACVTALATTSDSQPVALGKTEVVYNNLNPKWVKVFILDYELGVPLKVAINVFHEMKKGSHKSMGSAVFDIAEVLGSRGNTKAKKLKNGGMIFANVRKSVGTGVLRLQMKGKKLKNVEGGLFGKSDPFFELSKKVDNAGALTWDNVYRSSVIKNNLDPVWEAAVVELSILCGGDLDLPVLIEVFDHESNGKHKLIGKAEMSVNGMKAAAQSDQGITIKNKNKDCGTLIIQRCEVSGIEEITTSMANASISEASAPVMYSDIPPMAAPTILTNTSYSSVVPMPPPTSYRQQDFVDYISGGCELNVVVAIDFTGSNGDPRQPGTLHFLGGPDRNDYQKAIAAIVSILAKYDSDQKFPVLGFGAKYGGVVRHCFQCGQTEEVQGLAGVLEAYSQVFKSGLIMSGPTVFDEVINVAAARAQTSYARAQQNGSQAYTILLIVTDGAVTDPQATAACIDRVSDAPLSIVIVGVGNADFSVMQFLDDYRSATSGKRDIVQFVEFNKYGRDSVALTSETLKEIPDQLSGYFQSQGIRALPAVQRTDSTVSIGEAEDEIDLSLDIRQNEVNVVSGGRDFVQGFNASH